MSDVQRGLDRGIPSGVRGRRRGGSSHWTQSGRVSTALSPGHGRSVARVCHVVGRESRLPALRWMPVAVGRTPKLIAGQAFLCARPRLLHALRRGGPAASTPTLRLRSPAASTRRRVESPAYLLVSRVEHCRDGLDPLEEVSFVVSAQVEDEVVADDLEGEWGRRLEKLGLDDQRDAGGRQVDARAAAPPAPDPRPLHVGVRVVLPRQDSALQAKPSAIREATTWNRWKERK